MNFHCENLPREVDSELRSHRRQRRRRRWQPEDVCDDRMRWEQSIRFHPGWSSIRWDKVAASGGELRWRRRLILDGWRNQRPRHAPQVLFDNALLINLHCIKPLQPRGKFYAVSPGTGVRVTECPILSEPPTLFSRSRTRPRATIRPVICTAHSGEDVQQLCKSVDDKFPMFRIIFIWIHLHTLPTAFTKCKTNLEGRLQLHKCLASVERPWSKTNKSFRSFSPTTLTQLVGGEDDTVGKQYAKPVWMRPVYREWSMRSSCHPPTFADMW